MKRGAVFVDVAIDQGGCAESSRVTTHAEPTYVEEGVVHYCVANIPGAVSRTSTFALSNATLPYVRRIAAHGLGGACAKFPELVSAINIHRRQIVHPAVSEAFGLELGHLESLESLARS
jgi:alanine dehydrogenase